MISVAISLVGVFAVVVVVRACIWLVARI